MATEIKRFFYSFGATTKDFDKSIKNIDFSLSKIGNSFGRLQKIVSLAVGGKIVSDMSSFGMKMGLLSSQTNIGVKSLTALSSAFVSAGSNAATVQGYLSGLEKQLSGLSSGGAWSLGVLGINPYNKDGSLKTAEQVLYEIADWAKRSSDIEGERATRTRLMEQGADVALANMLMRGSDFIRGEKQRAIDEGRALDEETKDRLKSLKSNITEVLDTWRVSFSKVVAEASPFFEKTSEWAKKIGKMAGENPKMTTLLSVGGGALLGGSALKGASKLPFLGGLGPMGGALSRGGLAALALFGAYNTGKNFFPSIMHFVDPRKTFEDIFVSAQKDLYEKGLIDRYIDKQGELHYSRLDRKSRGVENLFDFVAPLPYFDWEGNPIDISSIPDNPDLSLLNGKNQGDNNYDVKIDMVNNIETASNPQDVANAIDKTIGSGLNSAGISFGMSSNTGG